MPLANVDYNAFGPQLDPKLVTQQIQSMRYNTTLKRAIVCPNRIINKNDHDLNCTVCDGTGFLYEAEGSSQKMLVSSISLRQAYQMQGRVDLGTAMITALPEVAISWWDRVTLLESTIRYTEVVKHSPANGLVDKLKYPIVDTDEKRGVWRLVGQTGVDFVLDDTFTVDRTTGNIVWSTDPGEIFYSIGYFIRPTYTLIDVNHHARTLPAFGPRGMGQGVGGERTVEFPVMALGKLDFLVGTEDR